MKRIKLPLFLFVYGSLKRGHKYHNYMENCIFHGLVKTVNRFALIEYNGYPALIDQNDLSALAVHLRNGPLLHVIGEMWEVTDKETLLKLDELEDHPKEYIRNIVLVTPEESDQEEELVVQTYFYKNFSCLTPTNSYSLNYSSW